MQLSTILLGALSLPILALSADTIDPPTDNKHDIRAACGDLGVMKIPAKGLPKGVDPDALRQCANHPAQGHNTTLAVRKCWFNENVGCTKGYCWKTCGQPFSGQWCWSAHNQGFGNWAQCKSVDDCASYERLQCGVAPGGGCDKCGCGC